MSSTARVCLVAFSVIAGAVGRCAQSDCDFNRKMKGALTYELATARSIEQREDALFLGTPGTGKSHPTRAIGRVAIQQGDRVLYREVHPLEEIAEATLSATPETCVAELVAVPLLIIDDLEMHKLPHTAEDGHRVRGTLTRTGVVRLTPRNCTLASV